jgi:hypothetical protein
MNKDSLEFFKLQYETLQLGNGKCNLAWLNTLYFISQEISEGELSVEEMNMIHIALVSMLSKEIDEVIIEKAIKTLYNCIAIVKCVVKVSVSIN